jgi:hypothetical protein
LNKKGTFLVLKLFKISEMYDDEDMAFSVQIGYLGSLEKKDKSKVNCAMIKSAMINIIMRPSTLLHV